MKLRKFAWLLAGALLLCLVAGAAALYWASHSEVALRWGIEFAARRLPGKLMVTGIHGALLEPVSIDALTYEDDALRVEAHSLALDWSPMALLHDKVDVSRLQIERMRIMIKPRSGNSSALPTDLGLPVQVRLASIEIGQLVVDGAGIPLDLKDIAAAYEGGPASHHLDLQKTVGELGRVQRPGRTCRPSDSGSAARGATASRGPAATWRPVSLSIVRPRDRRCRLRACARAQLANRADGNADAPECGGPCADEPTPRRGGDEPSSHSKQRR